MESGRDTIQTWNVRYRNYVEDREHVGWENFNTAGAQKELLWSKNDWGGGKQGTDYERFSIYVKESALY